MAKKITDLVHAGKYAEAQRLTTGLLVAYPDDQRLIKAEALLEKLLAPGGSANTAPGGTQPTNDAAPAQPATGANAQPLTGMDKVDYSALIVLARQAQQDTDLEQQKASLKQFMDQSNVFLQKYPDQMLLWQLRAASAISLNEPMAGFEAGQKLLAMGAADSNDPNLQGLLGQLKNKGWLDKQAVEDKERQAKYDWVLGTWSVSFPKNPKAGKYETEFSKSGLVIDGYYVNAGVKNSSPDLRGTILDSGEIRWEFSAPMLQPLVSARSSPESVWYPVISWEFGNDKKTMKIVYPNWKRQNREVIFTQIDSTR
jgi:hypothetical protein